MTDPGLIARVAIHQRVEQLEYALDQLARLVMDNRSRIAALEARYENPRDDNQEEEEHDEGR